MYLACATFIGTVCLHRGVWLHTRREESVAYLNHTEASLAHYYRSLSNTLCVVCVYVGPFSTPLFPHDYVHHLRGIVSEHYEGWVPTYTALGLSTYNALPERSMYNYDNLCLEMYFTHEYIHVCSVCNVQPALLWEVQFEDLCLQLRKCFTYCVWWWRIEFSSSWPLVPHRQSPATEWMINTDWCCSLGSNSTSC